MAVSLRSLFGTIRSRLIFGSLGLSIIPLLIISAVIGILATRLSSTAIETRVKDQLRAVQSVKATEIRDSFATLASALRSLASSEDIVTAMPQLTALSSDLAANLAVTTDVQKQALNAYYSKDFEDQFKSRNNGASGSMSDTMRNLSAKAVAMQYLFLARNPNPLGSKNLLLISPEDPSSYSTLHSRVQQQTQRWIREYGFYDIFLVDPNGDVVYTYFKELDFGTNLRNGPWAKTQIGEAYRQAALGSDPRGVYLSDFAAYRPSYDDQAAFMSTPLFQGGRRVGVLIAQVPIDRINNVLNFGGNWETAGLGSTGETVLIGADGTHRADSRRLSNDPDRYFAQLTGRGVAASVVNEIKSKGSTIGLVKDPSEPAKQAIAGQSTLGEYEDSLGTPVLAAAGPVDALNRRFGFVVKLDQKEAYGPIAALTRQIGGISLVTLGLLGLLAAFVALRLARSINVPLSQVQDTVQKVGSGDLDARTGLQSKDEIGQLAQAFDGMLDDKVAELARAQKENDQLNNSVIEIMMSVAQLAQRDLNVKVPVSEDVTGAVSDAINMMTGSTSSALQRVNQISRQVSESSERVKTRSNEVQSLANDSGIQANAASQELVSTATALREMGEQAQTAGREAEQALSASGDALKIVRETIVGINESRHQIEETEVRMKRLADISRQISSAVTIIEEIADRTSVLALTASMQAVAAGESGRGFAIVADEVKRLAENAHTSTQQISVLVTSIQNETAETLSALNATATKAVDMSRLADSAGRQMDGTRQATQALVASVRKIEQTTLAQSESSQRLLARAQQLIGASKRTLSEIELQREDTESLSRSATDLVSTVSEFKLPA